MNPLMKSKLNSHLARVIWGCSLLLIASVAHAQEVSGTSGQDLGDVGALVGVTWANHDAGSHVTWGGTAHWLLMPNLNVGLYYQRFTNNTINLPSGGLSYTTSYNFLAAEANYLFDFLPGPYGGGKLGWAITSVNIPNINDKNNVVFGPAVGYGCSLRQ